MMRRKCSRSACERQPFAGGALCAYHNEQRALRALADVQLPMCANCDEFVTQRGELLCHTCGIQNVLDIAEERQRV